MVRAQSLCNLACSKPTLTLSCVAQWAIARLQTEARHSTDAMPQKPIKNDGNASDNEASSSSAIDGSHAAVEVGRYHCTYQSHHGDLQVNSTGACYVTAVRSKLLWKLRYDDCKTIRKESDSGLIFELMEDCEFMVMGLKLRDEAFTQIIGYSGLAWQVTA